tara:strand:+ start:70 stop:489 length:420 start_codon:yes stop_codon:yes gene_type:complete
MAYRSVSTSAAGEVANQLSNLGISSAVGDQATINFLSGLGDAPVELNAAEYDAAKGFFEQRGYDTVAAESIAYVLSRQAKLDNVPVMKILDTLNAAGSDPIALNNLVGEILNLNRFKTSILGYKNPNPQNTLTKRNIKA